MRVTHNDSFEEIGLKASITRQNSYWQVIGLEGRSKINQDTFHTWDVCYKHLTEHMMNLLKNQFDYKFNKENVEYADADAPYHRRDERLDIQPDLLPRIVFIYSHNINQDSIVNIPSMEQQNMFRMKPRFTIATVQYKKNPDDGLMYNYMKDLSFAITGDYKNKPMQFALTLMVPNIAERIEVASMFKSLFPANVPHEIYAHAGFQTPLEMELPVNYDLEAVVPRELENTLKKLFGIRRDGEPLDRTKPRESDIKLLELLRKYCETPVDFKVIGGKKELYFVFRYKAQVILVLDSIEEDYVLLNNIKTHAVKVTFSVHYTEVTRYGIHAELTRPNPASPSILTPDQWEELKPGLVTVNKDINMCYWPDQINNTVMDQTYTIKVTEDMFFVDKDDNRKCRIKFYDDLGIPKLLLAYMKRAASRYKDKVDENNVPIARQFFNFVVIRQKVRKDIDDHVYYGTSPGVGIDYVNNEIIDSVVEPDENIYIALYLNKGELHTYLERVGYYSDPNMAREYIAPKLEK